MECSASPNNAVKWSWVSWCLELERLIEARGKGCRLNEEQTATLETALLHTASSRDRAVPDANCSAGSNPIACLSNSSRHHGLVGQISRYVAFARASTKAQRDKATRVDPGTTCPCPEIRPQGRSASAGG